MGRRRGISGLITPVLTGMFLGKTDMHVGNQRLPLLGKLFPLRQKAAKKTRLFRGGTPLGDAASTALQPAIAVNTPANTLSQL